MFAVHSGHTPMSVTHIFAKTNVGDRDELGTFFLDRAQGFLDHAIFRVGAARLLVFLVGNSEEQNGLKSEILRALRFIDHFVGR